MGLFDKVLGGGKKDHPALPSDHPAASRMAETAEPLRTLLADVGDDNVEIVPAEHNAYAFIGNPPKTFGLAWLHDGRVTNLTAIATERKLNPIKLERLQDALTGAYRKAGNADRFKAQVAGRDVVVIASEDLAAEVHRIVGEITNG